MPMIEGTAGAVPQRPGDSPEPSPGTAAQATGPVPHIVPGGPARGRAAVPGAAASALGTAPGDGIPGQDGTAPVPADRPERRPGEDGPGDAGRGPSPRHSSGDGDEAPAPADPGWLRHSINWAFALLSVAALLLAADGQIKAAERAEVTWLLRPFAPGVLELVGVLLMLLGYRRGRHGGSPWGYWALAGAVGVYAINLTSSSAPTIGAALLFGGASGALLLISFLKFREDLVKYQRDVLGRRPKRPPTFGSLWATNTRLARRALLLAIEFDLTTVKRAKSMARTWIAVYDDAVDFYRGRGRHLVLTPAPRDAKARAHRAADERADARGAYLARRAADAAVAKILGEAFHIPEVAQLATVAMQERPAITPAPGPGTSLPPGQDEPAVPGDAGGDDTTPGPAPAGNGNADRPNRRPEDGPDRPEDGPPPAPSGLTLDDMVDMIPPDLKADVTRQAATWDWSALLVQLDTRMPGWLTRPGHPTRPDIQEAYKTLGSGLGNTRASLLRRMVEAIRVTHVENKAIVAAATANPNDADVDA